MAVFLGRVLTFVAIVTFHAVECVRIVDTLIQGLVPSNLEDLTGLVGKVINNPNASPECQDIAKNCLVPGPLDCRTELTICTKEAFLGETPVEIPDMGDVDVEDIIDELAREANIGSGRLKKAALSECEAYLPAGWTSILKGHPDPSKEAPEDNFVCSMLTGRNVGQFYDSFATSPECDTSTVVGSCAASSPRPPLRNIFGFYLSAIAGALPGPLFVPTSTTSLRKTGAAALWNAVTVTQCLEGGKITRCIAAAVLADVCHSSCLIADCIWNKYHDTCVPSDSRNFFTEAGKKCATVADLMNLESAPLCGAACSVGVKFTVVAILVTFLVGRV